MMNGNGDGDAGGGGYGDTPNDLPEATLPEHRPYVLLLADIAGSLHQTANNCAELVHEFRVAREPMGRGTREKTAAMFAEVEELGRRGRVGFGG